MDKYIGLDVHATSCTAAVMDAQGKKRGSHVIETNGQPAWPWERCSSRPALRQRQEARMRTSSRRASGSAVSKLRRMRPLSS